MESVLRAAAIYGFLLLLFRVTGKSSLAQITAFDFVLLLIIGEATQQALLGNDFSIINAVLPRRSARVRGRRERLPNIEPRIADVTEPVPRILLEAAAEQPPDGRRGVRREEAEIGLAFQDPGDDVGGMVACKSALAVSIS